jgi:NAD(P)-dependent dehydrogenase (short-subunit alcohol dehydrogenase family)
MILLDSSLGESPGQLGKKSVRKYALITGASRGLGEALARHFWAGQYSLCLVARDGVALQKVVDSLSEREGQQINIFTCDLADPVSVDALAAKARASLPRLDVLINNAAFHGPIGPLWENDLALWRRAIQVNLLAPVALCRAFVPWMKDTGGGTIINLSGGGATSPRVNFTAYAAAKTALVRFSETLSEETKPLGIRVNCIAPGAMKTGLLEEVLHKGVAAGEREFAIASKIFAEGGASMGRVAELAEFLASDRGVGITGKLISAVWDNWENWLDHLDELSSSDAFTLRRLAGRDRGLNWADK